MSNQTVPFSLNWESKENGDIQLQPNGAIHFAIGERGVSVMSNPMVLFTFSISFVLLGGD